MILITGATDGIGLALARLYRARSEPVTLVGRRALAELDPGLFTTRNYCRADLSEPGCEARIAKFLDAENVHSLDVLIHNAGVGYHGPAENQSPGDLARMVAVNLTAPMCLTQALLPRLESAKGRIVLISSVVSVLPCPSYAVYGATKAALDDFARNLRIELARSPVRVQVIHPGAVNTGMHAKSGIGREQMDWEKFPSAESVAAKIARAIEGNRRSVTIGLGNTLLRGSGRLLPGLFNLMMRRAARRSAER